MTEWIIFYDDGSTFCSVDGMPEDAPREGVLVVAVRDADVGRRLLWNQDTYCWEGSSWVPHDRFSCERYLSYTKHPIRLCGYWRSNDIFWTTYHRALNDPRLPPKVAYASREQNTPHEWGRYGNEQE